MSALYTVKPLDDRSGFKGRHQQSPFESPWSSTRDLLARELRQLRASNVILEVDVLPGHIRIDGELKANARVATPAVRLHFDTADGHVAFPTDRFWGWQDNVRAIALGMEALRKIERYGIGRGDEQYSGFLQLEAGQGIALGGMTRDEAARILHSAADVVDVHPHPGMTASWEIERVWKRARNASHPDRHDGDQEQWDRVEQAAKTLGLVS